MATEQELIKASAENYRRTLDIIKARRDGDKPEATQDDKAEVERQRARVEQETNTLAAERAAAVRPTFKAPQDKLGVMAVNEGSKVPWDASKASQGFRLIKGNAKVVADEHGNPVIVTGKKVVTSKGAPKNDCAHVYWCSDAWELGESRNLPVAKAYQVAREVVSAGGIAWVERRLLNHKGEAPSTTKHTTVTDHKGMILPTCERGRFSRKNTTSGDSSEIVWTVCYDDGSVLSIRRELPGTDEQTEAQAKDLLLNGAFQNKTPMVASWDGHSFKRTDIIKNMPAPTADQYKRPSPQAMKVNKNNGKWVSKASQTRVAFSAG